MGGGIEDSIRHSRFERNFFDVIQRECLPREFDITPDVRLLTDEFVRTHNEGCNVEWRDNPGGNVG